MVYRSDSLYDFLNHSKRINCFYHMYKYLEELGNDLEELELSIKMSKDLDLFKKNIKIGDYTIPNSLASLPMEGGDSNEKGSPTELTSRKYENIARGGAGLIWLEAVSVNEAGRSNGGQLWITEENWMDFKE